MAVRAGCSERVTMRNNGTKAALKKSKKRARGKRRAKQRAKGNR